MIQTAGRRRSLNEPRTHLWSSLPQPVDSTSIDPDTAPQLGAIQPEEPLPCPLQHETQSRVPPAEPAREAAQPYLPTLLSFSLPEPFHSGDCRAGSGHMAHTATASRTHLLRLRYDARVLRRSRYEAPYDEDSVPGALLTWLRAPALRFPRSPAADPSPSVAE